MRASDTPDILARIAHIAAECDKLIAFWSGRSKGTAITIDYADSFGKSFEIIDIGS